MIRDKEIRGLYKMETDEHFQRMDEALLCLETNPGDKGPLDELMRQAHSLKGASRMAGTEKVEKVAHALEDIFRAVLEDKFVLTSEIVDRLLRGLDGLRSFVEEAVTGKASAFNADDAERELEQLLQSGLSDTAAVKQKDSMEKPGEKRKRTAKKRRTPAATRTRASAAMEAGAKGRADSPRGEANVEGEDTREDSAEAGVAPGSGESGAYHIDMVRVETRKLDALMTQAGELTVAKGRVGRVLLLVDELLSLLDEWNRGVTKLQRRPTGVGARAGILSMDESREEALIREKGRLDELVGKVSALRNVAYGGYAQLETVAGEVIRSANDLRLLPLSILFRLFPRMVRDLAQMQSKEVDLIVEGGDTRADKRILEEMKDPIMHLLRNAIDHGIEDPQVRERLGKPRRGHIYLRAHQGPTSIEIEVMDDGRGLDIGEINKAAQKRGVSGSGEDGVLTPDEARSVVFSPGFSTSSFITEVSGRGVGLDVVRAIAESLKGEVKVTSEENAGCTVRIKLPISLAARRVLIAHVAGNAYALPVESIEKSLFVSDEDIFLMEGRDTIILDDQPVSVARLRELLGVGGGTSPTGPAGKGSQVPCLIISDGHDRCGLVVDELLNEQEVVLKPRSSLLKRVRNVLGVSILDTGRICVILNPQDLMKSLLRPTAPIGLGEESEADEVADTPRLVLLAEDSITTRTQEKRILEGAGYEVVTAVDGLDAWNALAAHSFDAVVSDILMPNMSGLELTEKIRKEERYHEMPIILVTSLATAEDRKRGLEAGANAYISKGTFDQTVLLETLKRLA